MFDATQTIVDVLGAPLVAARLQPAIAIVGRRRGCRRQNLLLGFPSPIALRGMDIESLDEPALYELYLQASRQQTVRILYVVPHALIDDGLCYVMWGPRLEEGDDAQRVTIAALPEIRAVDRRVLQRSYHFSHRPSERGIWDVSLIDAEALLQDEAFWATADESHAAFRTAVRALAALPTARAARRENEEILRYGTYRTGLDMNDCDPNGNAGSQN